jgi:hypothetical protein
MWFCGPPRRQAHALRASGLVPGAAAGARLSVIRCLAGVGDGHKGGLKTRVGRGGGGMTLGLMEATDRLWCLAHAAGTSRYKESIKECGQVGQQSTSGGRRRDARAIHRRYRVPTRRRERRTHLCSFNLRHIRIDEPFHPNRLF